ncbi:hypothetical protein [Pseudomonas alloputida]|uniref:hypothetical protein n=1 Tax=Pseudomonas TaxID=286 RepID=UPI003EF074E2
MAQNKRAAKPSVAANTTLDPDSALLVPPTVPKVVPDVEGGIPNTVEFRATYMPLRVEFPLWAHSNPSETDNEYLYLYWDDVKIETKTFSKPVQPEELFILVPVSKLIEGSHRLHYEVTIFNDSHVASRPLDIYIDKTPPMLNPDDDRLGLPDYVIGNGVTEEYLAANGDKLEATVPPILGAEPGDVLKWFWSDDPVGQHMVDMMTLTAEHIETRGTQGISKPIELIFRGDFIRQSRNGTRFVRYEVQDRAGTAPQRALARSLQSDPSPPPRELPPPRIKEATGSDFYSTLDPAKAVNGVTFVIPEDADIRPGETVTVYWGEPDTLGGYSTSTPTSPGAREYLIPRVHVPPHMNNRVELYYQINKPDMPPSPSHFVTVRKIEGLPYVQSDAIKNNALNLRTVGSGASFTLEDWPFRHTSQFVNAWILGVERNNIGHEIRLPIATELPVPTEAGVMMLGIVSKNDLLKLELNYQFQIKVEVSFDNKVSWLKFPDPSAQLIDVPEP